jgi:hypothetical protein
LSTIFVCENSFISGQEGSGRLPAWQGILVSLFLGGCQYRIRLESEDEATAIARAMKIRANPELADINHLKLEIKNYIQHQFENHPFTRNSVASRTAVLNRWADHMGSTEVRTITADQLQNWYEWLERRKTEPLTERSAHSYLLMVRSLFNHLSGENKVRDNPAVRLAVSLWINPRSAGDAGIASKSRTRHTDSEAITT